LKPWRIEEPTAAELVENQDREKYFIGKNHNHPLFTLVTLLLYQQDGLDSAAHHHGLFRYTDKELKEKLGDDFDHYHILTDNISMDKLPPLSKLLRVADVAEAITGQSVDKPLDVALLELAKKAGYDPATKTVTPP